MGTLAYIHNMSDLALWTAAGAWAKPRFEWTYSDADAQAQTAWRIRIYNDSIKTTLLWDSGKTSGTALLCDSAYAVVLGTEYWFTLEVWDAFDEVNSTNPATTAFKVRWGRAIYEFAPTTWAGQTFASAAVPANTQKSLMFRGASAAEASSPSYGPWVSSVGSVDNTTYPYLQVCVRLATYSAGTQPVMSSMSLSYSGTTGQPDHVTTLGGSWALDSSLYRYGSRSFRCTITSNVDAPSLGFYRFVPGDDVPVQPNTDYVLSAFVRYMPDIHLGSDLVLLRVYAGGSDSTVLAEGAIGQAYGDGAVAETSGAPEGWKRLILRYRTGDAVDLVRPKVCFQNGGHANGYQFWVDAIKFEPGTVASPWAPGWVGAAVVMDSFGLSIDGSGGATLRLRNTAGTVDVDLDDIVNAAAGGGGGSGSRAFSFFGG